MTELVRDGLRLHYEAVGTGPETALFAHGITGTGSADWRRLLPVLPPRYRCVVPDLRGHGRSEFREGAVSFEAMREDLRALIERERMGQPHLIGFSMGAELMLSLELAHPGTARSLVLIGAATGCPPERAGAVFSDPPQWPKLLRSLHLEQHGPEHWRTLIRLIAGAWQERPEPPAERFGALGCPVLVIQGEDEVPYKRRQARELVAAAPDARLEVLAGADHPVHIQRAAEVNLLVRDFLARVDDADVSRVS